jgi:DNA-binding XRE family transcriptional regulator
MSQTQPGTLTGSDQADKVGPWRQSYSSIEKEDLAKHTSSCTNKSVSEVKYLESNSFAIGD